MARRSLALGCLALLLAVSSVQAGVVALKRSPGLTDGRGLAPVFTNAISGGTVTVHSGQGVIGDAYLYTDTGWAQSLCYVNTGAVPTAAANAPLLVKFDLSVLAGLAGGRVNTAELRFYAQGGNSGLASTGYITSSDWSEGNKTAVYYGYGDFPGLAPAAPGVSGAHPNGLNTGACQTASGLYKDPATNGYVGSWANDQIWNASKDGVAVVTGMAHNPWNIGLHPPYDQYLTIDVTPIVRVWATGTPNYGFFIASTGNQALYLSEETEAPDLQPILFIDYQPHGDPVAVSDLAVSNPDWFKLDLTWTAPSANPPAAVASYDIRYSTNPITDDASFAAASHCTCLVPTPAAPGTVEHFTIKGLTAGTTYYFAIKSTDIVGTVSALSNAPVSAVTLPMDVTPPAQITTLAAPNVKPNYAVLTWTAVGDDGVTGLANDYDFRYSTSPIVDDTTFAAATRIVTLGTPKAPGQQETFTIHGLTPSTAYWFAIKACDEVPNWSTLSNVVTFTTLAADTFAPNTITNLSVSTAQIHGVFLTWTAPADVGTAGMAGYDIRYSTSAIDDGNWASATQVTGEPMPAAPGTTEIFAVTGLNPSTTYYFAMKSFDYAEPANVSAVSNIASGTTMPPIVPVVVHNPWVSNDRVADTHNINTMAATYVNSYAPTGVTPGATAEQRAINIYNNQKRRLYHWADQPPNVGGFQIEDPTYTQNVFGWALCGRHGAMGMTISKYAGFSDTRNVGIPGHNIYEVFYDNGWHLYDTMTTMYVFTKNTPQHVASLAEISADHTIMTSAVGDGRACPGYLLCGDDPVWYAGDGQGSGADHWSDGGHNVSPTNWTGNMDLRLGQSFKRTWESWLNQHPTPYTNADSAAGNDPPYHHEANKDWKDTVNIPYWEPYSLTSAQTTALNIPMNPTYRRWANGTDTLAPDFKSAGYQAMLESASHDIATNYEDSLSPDLHAKTVGTQGEAIFKVSVPFYITDAGFSGDFVKTNSGDVLNVQVSSDGSSWTTVWTASALGTTHVANQPLRTSVFGLWQTWYVKVQIKSTVAKSDAGVSNFVVTTTFEHNKGSMAYLDRGVNNITLTFDNPAELLASRNLIHIFYKWKEYDGTAWTVDKSYEGYAVASPATFSITTGGAKVPRTEYVLMEVVPPVPDAAAPARITDLAVAGTPASGRVPLTWTATGDDGSTGTAIAYDLRYSTSAITDDATFNAATQVTGVPAPKVAGSTETFTVMYLQGSTTYYFAIKAIDKGINRSPLSNVVTGTTAAAVGVTNLAAGTATSATVPLTWTAIDDGSTGTYASYDLRYSSSPITDTTTFNAATQVTGVPAPKAAGQAESFTVTYLQPATTYYFALKGIDAKGNRSPLSNVPTATTGAAALITNLAAGAPGASKVPLTWTAIDDGVVGTETSYELRYSTSVITDATFNAATLVAGVPAPKAAGQAESFTVTGLAGSTTYSFAIKAVDAKGNRSPMSNVASATTIADSVPPQWVGNLKGMPSHTAKGVDLTWTAPADYGNNGAGPFPCAAYQLRYSTSPILYDDGGATWNAATAVTGLPVPKAPGSAESFTVIVPTGGATYYFAIKATDDASNISQVSNCAAAKSSTLGDTVLQVGLNGYTGCTDSYMDETSSNWGGNPRMTICGWGAGNYQRGIVKFDLSSLAGVNVTSATLSLYSYNSAQTTGSSGFYGLYPLTKDWTASVVNWTTAASGVAWTTPGGDFAATPDATSPKQPKASMPTWYAWDVKTRVQSWIAGTSTNYGWVVKCTDESLNNQDWLYQSESGDAVHRPKLVISDAVVPKVGDINGDGSVDVLDLLAMAGSWGSTCGVDRAYDPRCDLNNDGIVDVIDLLTLADNWR
jgi:hypothetical protein